MKGKMKTLMMMMIVAAITTSVFAEKKMGLTEEQWQNIRNTVDTVPSLQRQKAELLAISAPTPIELETKTQNFKKISYLENESLDELVGQKLCNLDVTDFVTEHKVDEQIEKEFVKLWFSTKENTALMILPTIYVDGDTRYLQYAILDNDLLNKWLEGTYWGKFVYETNAVMFLWNEYNIGDVHDRISLFVEDDLPYWNLIQ